MSSVIRSLMVRAGADLTALQSGFKQTAKELKAAGKQMTAAGKALTSGITVPAIAATTGIIALGTQAGQAADELLTMSAKTGLSTDSLQELEYAARFVDVEVETMTDSMVKLTRNMDMARKGSKDQADAFEALNVQYMNADGSLRNAKDVWADAIDALGQVSNEADRDALAMKLFGKSADELNPLIKAGSKELERLGKEAHDVGAVMSKENVAALGKFDDSMQKVQAVLKRAGGEIAIAFLPLLNKIEPVVTGKIVPAIKGFGQWLGKLVDGFTGLSPFMQKMIGLTAGLAVGMGPLLTVSGKVTTALGNVASALAKSAAAGGGFGATLSTLLGPAGIAAAAIAGVTLAVGALVFAYQESYKESIELQKQIDATKASIDQINAQFKEQNDNLAVNAELAGRLSDELYVLNDKEVKSNADKQRMKDLVGQLNEMYGDLNLSIDEQTGLLNQSRIATDLLIKSKEKEIRLSIYADKMTVLLKKQIELEDELKAATDDVAAAYNKVKESGYNSREAILVWERAVGQQQELQGLLAQNKADYQDVANAYAGVANSMTDSSQKITAAHAALLDTRDWANAGYGMGVALANGLDAGLKDQTPAVAQRMRQSASVVMSAMRREMGISSPSKITRGFGRYLMLGLSGGIGDELSRALQKARAAASSMVGAFSTVGNFQTPQLAYASPGASAYAQQAGPVQGGITESMLYSVMTRVMRENPQAATGGTITVPVIVNGREFARATAQDMGRELQALSTSQARGAGR
jgi:hypothetical protein